MQGKCTISREEATAAYSDAVGLKDSSLATAHDPDGSTDPDAFGDALWAEFQHRKRILKDGYPFIVQDDLLERNGDMSSAPSFFFLLGVAMSARYPGARQAKPVEGGRTPEALFEHVVTAAAGGLFGGAAVRFGWPVARDDPKSIAERVRDLADKLNVGVAKLDGKVEVADKDISLDVVGRLRVGDSEFGTVTFLVQCATGNNWESKKLEPAANRWEDLIDWESKLVRAVAVPWWWGSQDDYKRWFRRFDKAVVLDRARILMGRPDDRLANTERNEILRWIECHAPGLPAM